MIVSGSLSLDNASMTSNMHSNPVKYLIIFMARIRDHAVSPKICDSEGKSSHWQSRATYICIVVLVHYDSSIFTLIWIAFLCAVAGHVFKVAIFGFSIWNLIWNLNGRMFLTYHTICLLLPPRTIVAYYYTLTYNACEYTLSSSWSMIVLSFVL